MQLVPETISHDQTPQMKWQITCALDLLNVENLQLYQQMVFFLLMKCSVLRKIYRHSTRRISEKSVSMAENRNIEITQMIVSS